jgi:hypothetical protein
MFYFFLFLAGSSVGFLSGLLGIGGGIVMFPLLHYLPGAFGLGNIPVKDVTGLTMIQGFFASLSAMLFYNRRQLVNKELVLTFGISIFLSSFAGSLFSKVSSDEVLLFIFGLLALTAAAMMFIPRSHLHDDLKADMVRFDRTKAVLIALFLGFFLGMVGQGGAFITIPVFLYVLKIPMRVALGSTLAVGLFSSTAGVTGKVLTGQVPFHMVVPLILGAIPAARLGGYVGQRTHTKFLRWLLAAIISGTAVKVLFDIFSR